MIELRDVSFAYAGDEFRLDVAEMSLEQGERVALVGPSGIGKTTVLNLAAGILAPAAGVVRVAGAELSSQADSARRRFRLEHIGLVFQEFELLEYLSVRENILLPFRGGRGLRITDAVRHRLLQLAEAAGIADKLHRRPAKLSHGERQRVAVCRALITRPTVVLADEPTGSLDPQTAGGVLDLILEQCSQAGATLLAVTHDHWLLDRFDRVIDCAGLPCSM